jgi:hypothetical protein
MLGQKAPEAERRDLAPLLLVSDLAHNFGEGTLAGGPVNRGGCAEGARVQEIINAVTPSHRTRPGVTLPLDGHAGSAAERSSFQ